MQRAAGRQGGGLIFLTDPQEGAQQRSDASRITKRSLVGGAGGQGGGLIFRAGSAV